MEMSDRERFDMFVESARAFCSWIEGLPELPSDGLWDLDEALALISALLADGHRLPVVAPTDAEIADVPCRMGALSIVGLWLGRRPATTTGPLNLADRSRVRRLSAPSQTTWPTPGGTFAAASPPSTRGACGRTFPGSSNST